MNTSCVVGIVLKTGPDICNLSCPSAPWVNGGLIYVILLSAKHDKKYVYVYCICLLNSITYYIIF